MNVTLEPAELAVLLTLLDAQGIPGADLAHLFPEDRAERQKILDEGSAALERHGHYKLVDGHFHDLATPLLLAVAVLALPEQVITTTQYLSEGARVIGHYLAQELIVEFYRTAEGHYRLVALDSVETAIARIAATLELSGSPAAAPMTVTLPPAKLERLLELAQSRQATGLGALLDEAGIEALRARRVTQALARPRLVADIDLARAENNGLAVQQTVSVLAGAAEVVLLRFDPSGPSSLSVPALPAFKEALQAGLQAAQHAEP